MLDTAADLSAVALSDDFSIEPATSESFIVSVTNDGPTSAIDLELLIESPDGLSMSTRDDRCESVEFDQIVCDQRIVLLGEQMTVAVAFTAPDEEGNHTIVASATSKKFDPDATNNNVSSTVVVSELGSGGTGGSGDADGTGGSDEASDADAADDLDGNNAGTDTLLSDSDGSGSSGGGGGCTISGSGKPQNLELLLLLSIFMARFCWTRRLALRARVRRLT